MAEHIHKCPTCLSYTLEESCSKCGEKTILPKPAKYSPEDKYGNYRREEKKKDLKNSGLI
tara:strand:- start:591 stop:770 length:180 start_codon:yes stop_codon:yes gene_type:complete